MDVLILVHVVNQVIPKNRSTRQTTFLYLGNSEIVQLDPTDIQTLEIFRGYICLDITKKKKKKKIQKEQNCMKKSWLVIAP